MVEEHQCEQPARLRFLGGEGELAGEPDRLVRQVRAGGSVSVAGRVDEVEHAQHDGEVTRLVQAAGGWAGKHALGAADPLRHRRLRHVEGVGDLERGEAAHGAQGQRHLGGGREIGVAAAEEQEERVVALLGDDRPARPRLIVRRLLAAVAGGLAAAGVDEPAGRDRRQPRARVARRGFRPHSQRLQQRLLQRVLSGIEVLAAPDQACEHPRNESAQRGFGRAAYRPSRRLVDHAASVVRGRSHMTSRTPIHSYSGSPPGPGSEET